jgi:membrane fusion protein (multidrug efflux system)
MVRKPSPIVNKVLHSLWSRLPALFVLLLFVVIISMCSTINKKKAVLEEEKRTAVQAARPAINVVVLKLAPITLLDRINLPAETEPLSTLELKAEVSGKVTSIRLHEGSRVSKGDIIAHIDDRNYEAALSAAEAAFDLARKQHERQDALYAQSIIAESTIDATGANLEAMRAALTLAELNLERTTITAPGPGIIDRLDAEIGMLLAPGSVVAKIININPVIATVGIPESDVGAIRKVKSFPVSFKTLGKTYTGKTRFLSRAPENMAHMYKLELEIPNPTGEILPGMFARVDLIKREIKDALAVPLYAVITRGEAQFVFIEKDGKVIKRSVLTGVLDGWMLEITDGLMPGDNVIVVGHRSVGEQQDVNVISIVTDAQELTR